MTAAGCKKESITLKTLDMKKIFGIAITLCLLASAPAFAQLNFGVKAGMNLSSKPRSIDDAKGKTGFFIGPTAKLMLPIVGLGIEGNLLYSQSSSELGGEDITRRSIEVPIYLRYELSLPVVNKFLEPFVAVGPQFGWTMGDGDESWKESGKEVAKWEYKKSNLSLNLGAGATVLNHIQLHINYNIALGNTGEWKENTAGQGLDYIKGTKVNTWQVSAAYIF